MATLPSILVVEDDDDLRRLLAVALARVAHVTTASSADEALGLLRRDPPPRVVLTDVMMPGRSGLELARALRSDPRYAGVAIVMLTARTAPRDMVEGINAGARHYLTKPFRSADLEAKIVRLLAAPPRLAPTLVPPAFPPAPDASADDIDVEIVLE